MGTTTRMMVRPEKPEPKPTAVPKPATGKPKKKAAASVKTTAAKPTPPFAFPPTSWSGPDHHLFWWRIADGVDG